jgi:hypothetical protein
MSIDENLMCSFQIFRPLTQKTMQDTQIKGAEAHTPNTKSLSTTKIMNVKKWKISSSSKETSEPFFDFYRVYFNLIYKMWDHWFFLSKHIV